MRPIIFYNATSLDAAMAASIVKRRFPASTVKAHDGFLIYLKTDDVAFFIGLQNPIHQQIRMACGARRVVIIAQKEDKMEYLCSSRVNVIGSPDRALSEIAWRLCFQKAAPLSVSMIGSDYRADPLDHNLEIARNFVAGLKSETSIGEELDPRWTETTAPVLETAEFGAVILKFKQRKNKYL
jgi:hypothetical protein